ncbi:MAG: hypothetical protein Q9186_002059 [Xanthomendoza sp. 1 TL-2023]
MARLVQAHHLAYLPSSLFLIALAQAADQPSTNAITWLYPSKSDLDTQDLTFNTLDTLNVSWISTHTPAFLTLSCSSSSSSSSSSDDQAPTDAYTTILQLPVPATGTRLISLIPLALTTTPTPQTCHFSLSTSSSSPSTTPPTTNNNNNNNTSIPFTILHDPNTPPILWTPDSLSSSSSSPSKYQQAKTHAQASQCQKKDTTTSTMAAIGVGVAVGVFALTTAVFVLYEVRRRKKGVEGGEGVGRGRKGKEVRTERWIAKTLRSENEDGGVELEEGRGRGRGKREGQEGRRRDGDGVVTELSRSNSNRGSRSPMS